MEITDRIKQNIARHPEVPVLIALFALYMFLSNFFVWSLAFQDSYLNVSGGSDPYFNYYIVQYILHTHTQLTHTILLNYPVGTVNARPPFYQWSIVFAGYILSPFTGLKMGAYYAFQESDAFYGALLIIPVYLITKQIFGKKAGMFAAILFTIMPGSLTSGILTDGRAHTPELIFAFFSIYFFEMAVITAKKGVIIKKLTAVRSYYPSIKNYYEENKIPTIYALMSAVSLGGLIVFWQGFPYIEVVLLIYVVVQLLYNLIVKKPTGYLTYISTIYVAASFPIGFYYYDITSMLHAWFLPPLAMGLMIIGFGILINIVARKPWIITIPALVLATVGALFILSKTSPAILKELITGDGYFVKSRVYSTIAEAAAPPLGQYISDFGPGIFLLGIAGLPFIIYKFLKEKKEGVLLVIIFSIFSIFMSFEAARFNITAAPAYAILGGGLIMYFVDVIRHNESTKKSRHILGKKSLRKNISGVTVGFAVIVVLILIIPSGMGSFSAAVPENNAASYNHVLNSTVPKGFRPNNPFGNYGLVIDNKTQPLSASFQWLATQNTNKSLQNRPGYVSWWDYGFQELQQGKHPTVSDDFQQGIASSGQMLLAQNQSQEISLFISRVLQTPGGYSNGHFNSSITATMDKHFGVNETNTIAKMYGNPLSSKYTPLLSEAAYGSHQINITTSYNARHALIMGQLSTKYNSTTLISAYSALEKVTGSSISYMQVNHGLYPFSGSNPGVFYAPAYLTDTPSYTAKGQVVPTNYYNVVAVTSTGARYTLNKLPHGATVSNYLLNYTSAFYNTTIYKTIYGFPQSDISNVTHVSPAFNMSNFELSYYSSEYNPNKNANGSTPGWTLIPLQTAYKYKQENKGTEILLPASLIGQEDPITQYYPGAVIHGRVTSASGSGIAGAHVTIEDQYGIPHKVVTTNSTGYYSITGLPGNDTLVYSTGSVNSNTLNGTHILSTQSVKVSQNQGNRIGNYNITQNMQMKRNTVYGHVSLNNATSVNTIQSGSVILTNSTYHINKTVRITNGMYSLNSVAPYNYNVTVMSNGKTYTNFTNIQVAGKADQFQNLTVNMDKIDVSALINGLGLSGYSVYVNSTSGNYVLSGATSSNGSSSFGVYPGTYNVTIKANGTESKSVVTVSGWGKSKHVSLTPQLSANVTGVSSLKDAKISFYFDGQISDALNTTANSTGVYSLNMPYGIYTMYSTNTSSGVFAKTINVTGNEVQNISYSKAEKYTIKSTMNNTKDYSGTYEILAAKSTGQNYTLINYSYSNSSIPYVIYLPSATYSFSGTGLHNNKTMAGFNVSASSTHAISINLNNSYTHTIATSTNNTVGYVTQGIMLVYNNKGIPYYYTEITGGVANVYGYNNSNVGIESPYYHNSTVSHITNTTYYAKQNLVSVSLTIYNDSKLANYNGTITLTGQYNKYTLNMTNGTNSTEIAQGVYYTQISNKSAYITPLLTGTAVNSSASQKFVKSTDLYFTVKNINSTIKGSATTLFNSTGVNVGLDHIPAGNYTLISNNNTLINMTSIYVDKNMSINPVYEKGYKLSITNNLSVPASYHIRNGTKEITTSVSKNLTIPLPSLNFTITSSGNFTNSTGAYTYVNTSNNTVTPGSSTHAFNLSLTPTEVYSRLNGSVLYYSNLTSISGASITLTKNGKAVDNYTSSSGKYSFTKLTPGTYGIYAKYKSNGKYFAYFQNVTLQPFKNLTHNIYMMPAYNVTLTGDNNSKPVPTSLTVTGPSMYIMPSGKGNTIELPANGTYAFTITNTTLQKGTYVNYSASQTIFLSKSTAQTLTLHKDNVYKYTLVDPAVSGHHIGQKVNTSITVYNRGNTNNTLHLYSGNSAWNLSFNPENVTIPMNSNKTVSISTTIPDAPAGNNSIPIMGTVNGTNVDIGNITIYVNKGYGYNLTYSPYAEVNGTINMIPVTLKNTNNSKLNIHFNVTNTLNLTKNFDVLAYVTYNGKNVTNITLNYGQTATLYIYVYGINGRTLHSVPVDFESNTTIHGKNTYKNETITPVMPSATVGGGSSGSHIINDYAANPAITIYIGIGIIVAALLAGIIGSSMRSKKKR
jgi:dolichyl-diphosphooligosaccharide--protein glycosyltransferase